MSDGIRIAEVIKRSPCARAGVQPGERLVSINGAAVQDELDLAFLGSDEQLELTLIGLDQQPRTIRIRKRVDTALGIGLDPMPIRRCNSHCIFCFIDQNPPNLRSSLYLKDADFRLSFLHGNYITANELAPDDLQRIIEQRLFPLYISVHTTNPELRLRMLGIKRAPSVMERLRFFAEHGIRFHAQIVLCPNWNDGEELERTVRDLLSLGPCLLSIAVVPVGLTDFRQNLPALQAVTPDLARKILRQGAALQQQVLTARGEQILFFADEFYLLAEAPWPDYHDVEILHQLENGVGMLHHFYEPLAEMKLPSALPRPLKAAALTGQLGAQALEPLRRHLHGIHQLQFDVIPLTNTLFGHAVTVAGLLPGRDFQQAIRRFPDYDHYLIPRNALRDEGDLFLDGLSIEEIQSETKAKITIVAGDASTMTEAIGCHRFHTNPID